MSNALDLITGDIYATRDAFEACLADRSLNFEAEAEFAIQIISASDYLTKVARENRQSVVNAVTNVAAIGISLNPARKEAYLVPRKQGGGPVQVCLDISYMGLVSLAISCGAITMAQAEVVRRNDEFQLGQPGSPPHHKIPGNNSFTADRGDVVGIYVAAKMPSGDWHVERMTTDEINAIRDRSEAWKSLQAKKIKSCPWSTDWEEMAKKTVAKRASKWWRGNGDTTRLDRAIHHLNTENGEGLAELVPGAAKPPAVTGFDPDYWIGKVHATKDDGACMRVYTTAVEAATEAKDRFGFEKFKEAAVAHRKKLRNGDVTDVQERKAA